MTGDGGVAGEDGVHLAGLQSSVGQGDPAKTMYLINCSDGPGQNDTGESPNCDWYSPPARPKSRAAARHNARMAAEAAAYNDSEAAQRLEERIAALGSR